MPRRPRVNLVGYPQHIVQRGHNRAASFFGEDDYHCYLHWLKESADKYGCDIHTYALMTNHVHLLVSPKRFDTVPRLMQSLGGRYAQYVNRVLQAQRLGMGGALQGKRHPCRAISARVLPLHRTQPGRGRHGERSG